MIRTLALTSAAFLAACGGHANLNPAVSALPAASSTKIQHVVIIIQQGRSYNNLFNGFAGSVTYGRNSEDQKVAIKPLSLGNAWPLQHDARAFDIDCNGTGKMPGTDCRMNGFNLERGGTCSKARDPRCPFEYPPYAYVPHTEIKPYLDIAAQYVLGSAMFTSDWDLSSFDLNQYAITAQNPRSTYDDPSGAWGCSGTRGEDFIKLLGPGRRLTEKKIFPCWNATTLGDELDAANLTWAYYATKPSDPNTSSYQAIAHIYNGPDWKKDVFWPPSKFLKDTSDGKLRNVTWITPAYRDSDQVGAKSASGPAWVASIVNAVGKSKYWNSTAIFVTWDGAGGWYDPEPPQYVDEGGLGFRVPLLVISPYAKKDYISHVHYETSSILRFVENNFGLAQLSESDRRANSPANDCLNLNQSPRRFVPIRTP